MHLHTYGKPTSIRAKKNKKIYASMHIDACVHPITIMCTHKVHPLVYEHFVIIFSCMSMHRHACTSNVP